MVVIEDSQVIYENAYYELTEACRLHTASKFAEPLFALIQGQLSGTPCVFEPRLRFRPGEVTVWGGINGHGKSLITGQLALALLNQGIRSCIMSFEMLPARTCLRMMRQSYDRRPTVDDVIPFCKRIDRGIVFLNTQGSISTKAVLGAAIVAVQRFKTSHIFIDNLMKCVAGEDDYNAQKDFIQSICDIARVTGAHIHVIHHVRKTRDEFEELTKFSFRGAAAIVDQVDNAIIVQRNKQKEKAIENRVFDLRNDAAEPDTFLRIVKQRNGDYEGTTPLWFNRFRTAFCRDTQREPIFDLTEEQREQLKENI
jgi:twinkle protein